MIEQSYHDYDKNEYDLIFSEYFKRLANKTQVFSNANGSNGHKYRTRLTHSLEVGKMSKTIAKELGLNQDLSYMLGLCHDLGHSCFGHVGQDELNKLLLQHSNNEVGFEHNNQSIHIIKNKLNWGENNSVVLGLRKRSEHGLQGYNFGESQIMNKADSLVYVCGDVQDAVNMDKLNLHDFCHDNQVGDFLPQSNETYSKNIDLLHSDMMMFLKNNLVEESKRQIQLHQIQHSNDFCQINQKAIVYTNDVYEWFLQLKQYLTKHVYRSPEMKGIIERQKEIIENTFLRIYHSPQSFSKNSKNFTEQALKLKEQNNKQYCELIRDYISGCDDKFICELFYQR